MNKKAICITLLAMLLLHLISSSVILAENKHNNSPQTSSNQYGNGYRYNHQGWIYVHIEGTPYERGFQHGYLLAAEIQDMVNRWSHLIHNYPKLKFFSQRLSKERYENVAQKWWNFCKTQCFTMYWDKFPAEYKLEIMGIADGATNNGAKIFGEAISYLDILTINEMYEFMSKLTRIPRGIHPLRTLLQQLEQDIPELRMYDTSYLIDSYLQQEPAHHCRGFIATGNATTDGQMVMSHSTICGGGMWWWTYYISLRWNIILDIQPISGHRVIISTSPGLIWSDEDYYQNDAGITLLETTLPQGLFDNIGLPLSVRARNALQYGDSIDDVIYYLRYQNDGSMNAVWLIGDAKTGEIARFELGYRKYAVWRTFNGFYWSSNNPYDLGVRLEKMYWKKYFQRLIGRFLGYSGFGYYSIFYRPELADLRYEELGNQYYGMIDADVVKKIMSASIIGNYSTDCKITDTQLLKHNGLWAFFGNVMGKTLNISNLDNPTVKNEEVYPLGWTRIFALPTKDNYTLPQQLHKEAEPPQIIWELETTTTANDFSSSGALKNDLLYMTTSSGTLYVINTTNGKQVWSKAIGAMPTTPVIYGNKIFIGTDAGLTALDLNGTVLWETSSAAVVSSPVMVDDIIIFGDKRGNVYALLANNGTEQWSKEFFNEVYLTSASADHIILTSNVTCYAVNGSDGTVLWEFETNGMITAAPAVHNGLVYCTSWDNYIYALFEENGTVHWCFETGWGFDTPPIVADGLVFIGSHDNNMYAFDVASGSITWMFACRSGIHSNPVVSGDYIIFGSDDGRVYEVEKASGNLVWVFTPGFTVDDDVYNYITTPILSDPVANDTAVYVGARGLIYALSVMPDLE
jgi:outer membrane protein assembly factor BamB